ncbi:MAG: hypothetical protein ACYCQJ_13455 [Nitrososphaerales archaeon]
MTQVFEGPVVSSFRQLAYNTPFVFVTGESRPRIYQLCGNNYNRIRNPGNFIFVDTQSDQVVQGNDNFWYIYPKSFLRNRQTTRGPINLVLPDQEVVDQNRGSFYSLYHYDPVSSPTSISLVATQTDSIDYNFNFLADQLTGPGNVSVETPTTFSLEAGTWIIQFSFSMPLVSQSSDVTNPYLRIVVNNQGATSFQPVTYISRSFGNQLAVFRFTSEVPFSITPALSIHKTDTTGTLAVAFYPGEVQVVFRRVP